ncbi:MAG: hypothetical protein IKI17_04040 [Oscillospiraceae bacterium]|nr:hypothetical protein [Oscillospiraceae bacterium]
MPVIYEKTYKMIRKKLCSDNPKIIKTGIQDMLYLFETGHRFAGGAKDDKADFKAFIMELLRNNDYDVRKWLYHLLCFCPLWNDKEDITSRCLDNISLELEENNIENISWIVAVCGVNCDSLSSFDPLLRRNSIFDYLSPKQVQLASSAFRIDPLYVFDRKQISSALEELEPISPIWLTKMYANQFLPIMKRHAYLRKHGEIPTDAFVQLLKHPDREVRKYVMWAFAQEPGGNMSSMTPYVPLDHALSLEAGIQKWYFVKLFQDHRFLNEHEDFIQQVGLQLHSFPTNVREGILIGCKKLGYSDSINDFILDWEQDEWESSESIRLGLYEYIANNINNNQDFVEITRAVIRNIEEISFPSVQIFLRQYLLLERSNSMSQYKTEIHAQNVQYNVGGNNSQINTPTTIDSAMALGHQKESIDHLKKEIEELRKRIDQSVDYTDERIEGMVAHLDYGLKDLKESTATVYSEQIQQLSEKLQGIVIAKPKKRGEKINDFLSTTANIATVAATTPQLIGMINDFVQFIGTVI